MKTQIEKTGEKIEDQKELEREAAETLLDEEVGFEISGMGHYSIKGLKLATLIKMSIEATKVKELSSDINAMGVIASVGMNAKPLSMIIAHAIEGNRTKTINPVKKYFAARKVKRFASKLIENLGAKELHQLYMVVIKKSDPSFFLSCTNLANQMRIMKPKATKEI